MQASAAAMPVISVTFVSMLFPQTFNFVISLRHLVHCTVRCANAFYAYSTYAQMAFRCLPNVKSLPIRLVCTGTFFGVQSLLAETNPYQISYATFV